MSDASLLSEHLSFLAMADSVRKMRTVADRQCYCAESCDDAPMLAWKTPVLRMEMVTEGELEMLFSGQERRRHSKTLKAGDVLFVASNGWNLPLVEKANTLSICFRENRLWLSYNHWQDGRCVSLARWDVASTEVASGASERAEVERILTVLALALEVEVEKASRQRQLFHQILTYLRCHFDEPICRDSVACHFCISPSYLSHLFMRYGEVGFNEYINRERFAHAQHLLVEKGLRVKQAALESGFVDADYFCRLFKRLAGMTPTQYRKRHHALVL